MFWTTARRSWNTKRTSASPTRDTLTAMRRVTAGEWRARMQLLRDHQVQYADDAMIQLPHPLEHRMLIKVQTTGQTAAPVDVLKAAIVDLQGETEALDRGFRDGVAAVRERQMQI